MIIKYFTCDRIFREIALSSQHQTEWISRSAVFVDLVIIRGVAVLGLFVCLFVGADVCVGVGVD